MADRKEPPFYDDDSVGAFRYKLPFYDTMELFIETLTGTCFELRVSPFETVMSVKAKIQRLEGIPVAQQHLIWNNLELEDEYCLHDYSIAEGCTLKLVLALRGGPINTRRVAMEDPVREMADLVEGGKEEGWEKSLPNKQITFLVYREGDQLNFFRVVDRGDGTLTPVSESLSGGSVCNAYAEEDEEEGEEGGCGFSAGRQSRENSITMNKMKLLKAKMEDMNLNKKPKKSAKLKPRPPVGPRPCGGSFVPPGARPHRLLRVLPQTGQSQHPNNAQLPPIRDQHQSASPSSSSPPAAAPAHLSVTRRAPPTFASSSCYMLREEEPWESCPALAKLRPPPKVSRLDACGARLMRDCVYPPLPALSARGGAAGGEPARDSLGPGSLEDAAAGGGGGLMEPSQAGASYGDLLSDPLSLDVSTPAQGGAPGELDGVGAELGSAPTLLSQAVGPAGGLCTWGLGPADKPGHALHASPASSSSSSSSPPPPLSAATVQLPRPFEFTGSTLLRPDPPTRPGALATPDGALPLPSSSSSSSSSPPRAARLRGVKADSPCKRTPSEVIISKSEARGVARTASQARKEPLGFLSNAELLASLASREGLGQSLGLGSAAASASGLGRLGPASAAALPASIQLLQDDLLRRMSPLHRAAASYTSSSGLGSAGGASSSIRRLGTPNYHLPPVKAAAASKKKSSKHCFLCGKKTGLATSYECRCGNNFCATHRYAETHDCTYDYKSAGRRFLQETNPIINAPKLPKI